MIEEVFLRGLIAQIGADGLLAWKFRRRCRERAPLDRGEFLFSHYSRTSGRIAAAILVLVPLTWFFLFSSRLNASNDDLLVGRMGLVTLLAIFAAPWVLMGAFLNYYRISDVGIEQRWLWVHKSIAWSDVISIEQRKIVPHIFWLNSALGKKMGLVLLVHGAGTLVEELLQRIPERTLQASTPARDALLELRSALHSAEEQAGKA